MKTPITLFGIFIFSMGIYAGDGHGVGTKEAPGHKHHSHHTAAPQKDQAKAFKSGMESILVPYLAIQSALAANSMREVAENAKLLKTLSQKVDASKLTGKHAMHFKNLPANLLKSSENLAKATDLKTARNAFKAVSKPMAMWASMMKPKGVYVVYCDMAKGSWLQKSKTIRNPYYGPAMPQCGVIVS